VLNVNADVLNVNAVSLYAAPARLERRRLLQACRPAPRDTAS
jgi:hypothetical protein